jgi:hypothetical protein
MDPGTPTTSQLLGVRDFTLFDENQGSITWLSSAMAIDDENEALPDARAAIWEDVGDWSLAEDADLEHPFKRRA